jgi:hypothetical protein
VSEPLYVRDGSRFVVYDPERQHTPPIPVPQPTDLLPGFEDPDRPGRTILIGADRRCPHGHFLRWAAANCRGCARSR